MKFSELIMSAAKLNYTERVEASNDTLRLLKKHYEGTLRDLKKLRQTEYTKGAIDTLNTVMSTLDALVDVCKEELQKNNTAEGGNA